MRSVPGLKRFITIGVLLGAGSTGFAYYNKPQATGSVALDYSINTINHADLIDHHGEAVKPRVLNNKLVLMNFFFTSCGNACPVQTAVLKNARESIDSDIDIEFLSVTIAPLVDSQNAIRDYVKKFDIENSNWRFARTGVHNTQVLIDTFGVSVNSAIAAEKQIDPDTAEHRNMAYLFDRKGRLMQQYQLTPGIESRLVKEISALHAL